MATATKAELETFEVAIQQFRVNELHILLSSFRCPKLGKKNELVQRCIALLHNGRNQAAVMQKIRDISSSRRYTSMGPSGTSMQYGQIDTNIMNNTNVYHSANFSVPNNVHHQFYVPSHQSYMVQQPPQQQHHERVKSLRISDLPFFDQTHTILELVELPASNSSNRMASQLTQNFIIPAEIVPKVMYRSEDQRPPRQEIQMRFFFLDTSAEQQDDFPPSCSVKINEVPVTLPNVIPTNKPNVEPKRPSRPVNVTQYCQTSPLHWSRPFKLHVEWLADKRAWAVGLYAVIRLSSDILWNRLVESGTAFHSMEITKRVIRDTYSSNSEDGVEMDKFRVSLLCPLGKARMVTPVKGVDCVHLQCYDLRNFLLMNEKRPTWKCPVCDRSTHYKKLRIDGYFENILKSVDKDVHEVELLVDGNWRAMVHHVESLSDDDEPLPKQPRLAPAVGLRLTNSLSTPNFPNAPSSSYVPDDGDVIVLGDSDDEVEEVGPSCSSRKSASTSHTSRPQSASDRSIVCIDLDESDSGDVPATPTIQQRISPAFPQASSSRANAVLPQATSSLSVPSATAALQKALLASQVPHTAGTPWFGGGAVVGNSINATTHNNPAYFSSFEAGFDPYQSADLIVAEGLRNFMANIQQSTTYPRFS